MYILVFLQNKLGNTRNTPVSAHAMLVIEFKDKCRLKWLLKVDVNYHQQAPPHLGFTHPRVKFKEKSNHEYNILRYTANIKLFQSIPYTSGICGIG